MKPPRLCFLAHLEDYYPVILWSHLFPQSRLFPFGDLRAWKQSHSRPVTTMEQTPQGWASGNTALRHATETPLAHAPEWLAILWTISSVCKCKISHIRAHFLKVGVKSSALTFPRRNQSRIFMRLLLLESE